MNAADKAEIVRRLALEAGFDRGGIAAAVPVARLDYVREWLDTGRAGEMYYLERHRELHGDPAALLPGARSVIVVADNYRQPCEESAGPPPPYSPGEARGRIARYAWGRDYHRVLRKKLHHLADRLHEAIGEPFETRVCVDTAPLVEREVAAAAGIGWIGKNTLVLHQELGSFFFLGEIITTLDLTPSGPVADHCGSCTRCLDACPTGALDAPYRMDATRCISYLTIEHRGKVAAELQPLMEGWIFGCDICQDVCPFNRKAPTTRESRYRPDARNPLPPHPRLDDLLSWTDEQYREHLAGTAMKRATLAMLKRNAEIARKNVCGQ